MKSEIGGVSGGFSRNRQILLTGMLTFLLLEVAACGGGTGATSNQSPANSSVTGNSQLTVNAQAAGQSFPSPPPPVPFALYLSQVGEQVTGALLQETNGCMDKRPDTFWHFSRESANFEHPGKQRITVGAISSERYADRNFSIQRPDSLLPAE